MFRLIPVTCRFHAHSALCFLCLGISSICRAGGKTLAVVQGDLGRTLQQEPTYRLTITLYAHHSTHGHVLVSAYEATDDTGSPIASTIIPFSEFAANESASTSIGTTVLSAHVTLADASPQQLRWEVADASTCLMDVTSSECQSAAVIWEEVADSGSSIDAILDTVKTAGTIRAQNGSQLATKGLVAALTVTDIKSNKFIAAVQGLNATGEFLTVRYSQLNYSLAVHLPWEDFDPIGEVALADFNGSLTRFSDEGIDSNHTQMWFTTLQQDDEGTVVIDEHSFTFDIPATGLCTSSLQISVEAVTAIGTLTTLLQTNGSTYYTPGTNCSWKLSADDSRKQRYSFTVDRRGMGPGTTLQIYDASRSELADEDGFREYTAYSGSISNDLIIEATTIGISFIANSSAEPALGPKLGYEILPPDTRMSTSTVRKIILAGGVTLFVAYVVLSVFAWRRYKANDLRQQQAERTAARQALQVIARRRAREAIAAAAQRMTDMSNALPEHLLHRIRIEEYREEVAESSPNFHSSTHMETLSGLVNVQDGTEPQNRPLPLSATLGEDPCAICLADYEEAEDIAILPCGHKFHGPCVHEWLAKSRLCPLCKDDTAISLTQQQAQEEQAESQA